MSAIRERSDLVERLHREALIVEGHRDCYEQIHRLNMGEENPIRDALLPRLRVAGVDALLYAIGGDTVTHCNGMDRYLYATIENIEAFRSAIADPTARAALIERRGDLPERSDGTVRFLLHLEGGRPLEGGIASLQALYRLGVRSMQITWNLRNELADGVRESRTGGGLSRFGVAVVREMERLRMVIDLSHIAPAGFWQVLEVSERPLIVSHANCQAVLNHPRNLSDDQIRAIGERDGVIGVHCLPAYVDPERATVDRLVDHVAHIAMLIGPEHAGVGADFTKSDGPRPAREQRFPRKKEQLDDLGEIDELPHLTWALLRRGFSEAEVAGILGGNFLRVLRRILPE